MLQNAFLQKARLVSVKGCVCFIDSLSVSLRFWFIVSGKISWYPHSPWTWLELGIYRCTWMVPACFANQVLIFQSSWALEPSRSGFYIPNVSTFLGGGFTYFLFSPLFGEDSHFYANCFAKLLNSNLWFTIPLWWSYSQFNHIIKGPYIHTASSWNGSFDGVKVSSSSAIQHLRICFTCLDHVTYDLLRTWMSKCFI